MATTNCNDHPIITNINTSKLVPDYMCDSGVSTIARPYTMDDDESIPHLAPEVSDVSAYDYLHLKSSILAIEQLLVGSISDSVIDGVPFTGNDLQALNRYLSTRGGFSSIAGELYHFNTDRFVPIAGNCHDPMTGPLIHGNNQISSWGNYCETFVVFAAISPEAGNLSYCTDITPPPVSLNTPAVGQPVSPFVVIGAEGVFEGRDLEDPESYPVPRVVPLSIVGHDATPTVAGTKHRRVKVFDDLEVNEDLHVLRNVIGVNGYFDNIYINTTPLDDKYVLKAGDTMTGQLNMSSCKLVTTGDNGGITLDGGNASSSPYLKFKNLGVTAGIWNMYVAGNDLVASRNSTQNASFTVKNIGGAKANIQVEGKVAGLADDANMSGSAIDFSQVGRLVAEADWSSSSPIIDGKTASPNSYQIPSGSGGHFKGSQDFIQHFNNVNAHHEEKHPIESHIVFDHTTQRYRPFYCPEYALNAGEVLEVLMAGPTSNADQYHTHAGQRTTWWTLWRTADNPQTISEYVAWYVNTYACLKPCGGGGGSSSWDEMPKTETDGTKIREFVLGKNIVTSGSRLKGSAGFTDTSGFIYGYKPYWSLLERGASETVNITDYITGMSGSVKGIISPSGYGYLPYWGNLVLDATPGSKTIMQWAQETFCAKPCGGTSGSTDWVALPRVDPSDPSTIDQAILGSANGHTPVGQYAYESKYGYQPYWGQLKAGSSVPDGGPTDPTATIVDWALATFCPISGGCGGGPGEAVYWGALTKSIAPLDTTTIEQFITGKAPGVTGTIGASPTYGYKPYWGGLVQSGLSGAQTIDAWVLSNVHWGDRTLSSTNTTTIEQFIIGKGTVREGYIVSTDYGYKPYWWDLKAGPRAVLNGVVIPEATTIQQWADERYCPITGGCGGGGGGITGGANQGTGVFAPYVSVTGNTMNFATLKADGVYAEIVSNGANLGYTINPKGVKVTNAGATGINVYAGTSGTVAKDLSFKTVQGGTGISVTESNNVITVSSSTSGAQKIPYIYPVEIEFTAADSANTVLTRAYKTKADVLALIKSMYNITSSDPYTSYTWYIAGGVNQLDGIYNIKAFRLNLKDMGDAFQLNYQIFSSGPHDPPSDVSPYTVRYQGIIIAIHS